MKLLQATYHIIKPNANIEKIAEKLAIGLTVGSWTDLSHQDQVILEKYKGQVINSEYIQDGVIKITIGYPLHNFTYEFSSILTTTFGKLSLDGKVKLVDLIFPEELLAHFKGPAFGIKGIRDLLDIHDRPLVMSIFKGIIGRDAEFFENQLRLQALSVDCIKDDEILYDIPELPFETRIKIAKRVLDEIYETTGKRVLYAVNLSGPVFQLKEKARRAKVLGANALLFNVHTYGLDVLKEIRDLNLGLPIFAHPAFSGAICGSHEYGLSYPLLLSKLTRIAGADFILFPAPFGSVPLSKEDALLIVTEARNHLGNISASFPVPSAGIHPGLVHSLIEHYDTDIVINAGGGVHGHPSGTTAGGQAFQEAIEHYYGSPEGKYFKEAKQIWGTS